jgi:hypothetical protein
MNLLIQPSPDLPGLTRKSGMLARMLGARAEIRNKASDKKSDATDHSGPHQVDWPRCPTLFLANLVIATVVEGATLKKGPFVSKLVHTKAKRSIKDGTDADQ